MNIDLNKILLFRFHRGLLEDSMKTCVEIKSLDDLIWHINYKMDLSITDLEINYYLFDDRISWNTHIVTGFFMDLSTRFPVGFLNRKPDWI